MSHNFEKVEDFHTLYQDIQTIEWDHAKKNKKSRKAEYYILFQ